MEDNKKKLNEGYKPQKDKRGYRPKNKGFQPEKGEIPKPPRIEPVIKPPKKEK